jgi:Fimbrial assembly protein (PilN)
MNHKLDLDFVQRSFFSPFSLSLVGLIALIVSFAMANFTWQQYQDKQSKLTEISSKLSQLNHPLQQKKLTTSVEQTDISAEQKIQIDTTIDALAMPWNALFSALEKSDTKDVALLVLEPNSKNKQIILTGEAKNLLAVLNYVSQLETQPILDKVYLQKYNLDETNVSKPVKFTVLAQWQM